MDSDDEFDMDDTNDDDEGDDGYGDDDDDCSSGGDDDAAAAMDSDEADATDYESTDNDSDDSDDNASCHHQEKMLGASSSAHSAPNKHFKSDNSIERRSSSSSRRSCILEFDGASKGNPGLAGAGAVLRREDGSVACKLRVGIGNATNNVAEYRAVLLGLEQALKEGFTDVHVQGDSQLVCKQMQGEWKTRNHNMADLCNRANELMGKFKSVQIEHVRREFNSEADAQANQAVKLRDGQVEVDRHPKVKVDRRPKA